jgi:urease gamma subunit
MNWNPFAIYRKWKYDRQTKKAFDLICDQITEWLRAGYSVDEVMGAMRFRTGSDESDAEIKSLVRDVVDSINNCVIVRDKRKRFERERKCK